MPEPRLRTVQKYKPPYPLNKFPDNFVQILAEEFVHFLATNSTPNLEGNRWEEIFAKAVGAAWKPSNVGLDDIVLEQTAWGAKSVKSAAPHTSKSVRLISGRNSPIFSYGERSISKAEPDVLGAKILEIFNERVAGIRALYRHVRTVVLIKSLNLSSFTVFEFETAMYPPEMFIWKWNANDNLEGFDKDGDSHRFTWQPHGSQFTIVEPVPADALRFRLVKTPEKLDKAAVLKTVGFAKDWIEIVRNP
ncbi:MAG TPA: hypothetical protein VFA90_10100 [Terriglobales bacterium]|nr:hypothetical protein [Terriglobales bacterium]